MLTTLFPSVILVLEVEEQSNFKKNKGMIYMERTTPITRETRAMVWLNITQNVMVFDITAEQKLDVKIAVQRMGSEYGVIFHENGEEVVAEITCK